MARISTCHPHYAQGIIKLMELKKDLNLLNVFCISTGAMLSGLFILPGKAYAYQDVGPAVIVAYIVAALLAATGLMSQAELVSAMPKSGGAYFYITRSMGSAVGTVYGLITWFSLSLKSAYELFFMAVLIKAIWITNLPQPILAIGLCSVFIFINLVGVKEASKLQVWLVAIILIALTWFCAMAPGHMDADNLKNFVPKGNPFITIFAVAGYVFVAFGGLLKVASIAEEVKNPGKTIPQAMILSMIVISFLYVIINGICVTVLGDQLIGDGSGMNAPLSLVAEKLGGNTGRIIFVIAALLAIVTSANAGVMTASRYPLALAKDEMLPKIFQRISRKFQTPYASIIATGLIISVAFFIDIKSLIKAASSVLIMTYIFSCLAVVILRESKVQNYQPQFKSLLYPWIQLVGMIGFLGLLFAIGAEALALSCAMMVVGFMLYWVYGRKKASKEYALLHLIERITAKDLTDHGLENELKTILHERDEIMKDRFDHLIEDCLVLDFDKATDLDTFFMAAAEAMSEHLEEPPEKLFERYIEREKESATVMSPFLAIPHIVIEGERHFDILLARCKDGFHFSQEAQKVHTVCMLVGTKDERQFHLTSLAAIVQVVQSPTFERQWLGAKNEKGLKDIFLLSNRQRIF